MSSSKGGKKPVKTSKTSQKSKGPVASGLEDFRVKVPDKSAGASSTQDAAEGPIRKVEMQTLRFSKELENQMLDTLRHLYGENFTLKNRAEYRDKGTNLGRQYWMDRGGLVVLGGVNYSLKNRKKTFAEENAFALSKLEKYGFHKNHCIEALQTKDCDVGASLEFLISHYFHLDLPSLPSTETVPDDILEQRSDETATLESMYESMFVVRLPNRVWTVSLDLPYLLELYMDPKTRNAHVSDSRVKGPNRQKSGKSKEMCNFFASGKHCKYGDKCKFSHIPLRETNGYAGASAAATPKEINSFVLEIRFPPGSQYPIEPPLVCISTEATNVPPEVCLRISSRLVKEAKDCAQQGFPCVYSLVELLLNQPEVILEHLKKIGEAFPDPYKPLIATETCSEESSGSEECASGTSQSEGSKRQPRTSINMSERMRLDERMSRKFVEKTAGDVYTQSLQSRKLLPAWGKMVEILAVVGKSQVVIITGETGCGKSTQVPQFLLDDWLLNHAGGDKRTCEIVCTQPRRLSAIGVAERVAEERGDRIGDAIGYQIRLESKVSSATRLLFCTTGILLRRLESDPKLQHVSHIIVDEVHERSEESDFLLLIIRELLPLRPDLRVILMSATVNANLFASYFGGIPRVEIPGRTFPVQQIFLDEIIERTNYVLEEDSEFARKIKQKKRIGFTGNDYDASPLECELKTADVAPLCGTVPKDHVRDDMLSLNHLIARYSERNTTTVKTLYLMDPEKINYELIETVLTWIVSGDHSYPREGSILVFLPGIAEIRSLHKLLTNHPVLTPKGGNFVLVPLHSSLTSEEQTAVFRKPRGGARKIVLSTNIAETSITIDDCIFVVDAGRVKEKRFDTSKNMESLDLTWVSRANAAQRRGRAGRVKPGVCVHLYTKYRHDHQFLSQPVPELHRMPLEQLILRIKVLPNFYDHSVHQVFGNMLEPPEIESVDTALARLQNVGAIDENLDLTPLGHHLAQLPVDVRIGKLMLFGAMFCCVDSVLTMAACLSYKSPFSAPFNKRDEADAKRKAFAVANSDQLTSLKAYSQWLKASSISRRAGDVFAEENFLSWRTLVTIADMKHQFLELLADIGFVSVNLRRRNSGVDRVLEITGSGLNEHGDNEKLLIAILCAALYPNIVKVLTPAKTFCASIVGAIPKQLRPDEISFKTKQDGYVNLHPSSVIHSVGKFASPYLVYQEKVKTSRVFIRDCSMVSMMPLVLFAGKEVTVELHQGTTVISLEGGWIMFAVDTHQAAELLNMMRVELDKIMQDKIREPTMDVFTNSKSKKVISTIIALITQS